MHQRQIVALLSLVCALLYCNTLFSEFVFDDTFAIVRFRISACKHWIHHAWPWGPKQSAC